MDLHPETRELDRPFLPNLKLDQLLFARQMALLHSQEFDQGALQQGHVHIVERYQNNSFHYLERYELIDRSRRCQPI